MHVSRALRPGEGLERPGRGGERQGEEGSQTLLRCVQRAVFLYLYVRVRMHTGHEVRTFVARAIQAVVKCSIEAVEKVRAAVEDYARIRT